jgi:hypothetical protein
MKLLHLVLYSDPIGNECYDEMRDMTREYYKRFNKDVKTIYYKYANISEDYEFRDDMLLIKGTESFVPGVLDKTIKAIEYVCNTGIFDEFDAIVRSNISSIINFDLLRVKLNELKNIYPSGLPYYSGARIETLGWTGGGIHDSTYFGLRFACGICFVLSKPAVYNLLANKDKIRMDIIDDVSLAIFHKEHVPNAYPPAEIGSFLYMHCFLFPQENGQLVFKNNDLLNYIKDKDIILYRNKYSFNVSERKIDAMQMRLILDYLQKDSHRTP